jgi:hypothetical protein
VAKKCFLIVEEDLTRSSFHEIQLGDISLKHPPSFFSGFGQKSSQKAPSSRSNISLGQEKLCAHEPNKYLKNTEKLSKHRVHTRAGEKGSIMYWKRSSLRSE